MKKKLSISVVTDGSMSETKIIDDEGNELEIDGYVRIDLVCENGSGKAHVTLVFDEAKVATTETAPKTGFQFKGCDTGGKVGSYKPSPVGGVVTVNRNRLSASPMRRR